MSERLFKTYGLPGESENRVQREIEGIVKSKADANIARYYSMPKANTLPQGQPVLVKVGSDWTICVRIEDTIWKFTGVAV